MNIVINEEEFKIKSFAEFNAGELMIQDGGTVIHIKTSDGDLVNLLTGYSDSSIGNMDQFVDVTDKYILTNTTSA